MTERSLLAIEIQDLQEAVRELCTEKGWREHAPGEGPRTGHEFGAYLMLGVTELSEAMEAYRDKVWSDTCLGLSTTTLTLIHHPGCSGKPHTHPKPVGVGPEFADVFIRLLDMCDLWGIDLIAETTRVMQYGWTRSYRHGGRQL